MDQVAQKTLFQLYRQMSTVHALKPDWNDLGFRVFSQNEEDGLLLFIFSLIGFKTRRVVEICCGSGRESNTANLLINHNCVGLLFEGDETRAKQARQFFQAHPDTRYWPPQIVHAWVTAENVNLLLADDGMIGDVDLLSIDVDGVDYWLWRAIDVIKPRVAITEINHLWGADAAVTVPYAPDFKAVFTKYGSDYAGASIAAFCKLGAAKGYRLVGANALGTNAIFVRNELQHPWLPETAAGDIFWHPRTEFGRTVRFAGIEDMDWERV